MSKRQNALETDGATLLLNQASELPAESPGNRFRGKEEERRRNDREKVYGSVERQSFLVISILLASCCGCFNLLTLVCSIPAVLASIRSHHATERGDHRRAGYLGNLSIALMLLTVLLGAVLFIFLVAIVIGLAPLFSPCGFSIHKCTWDMFGRELNTLTCLRFPL